MAGYLIARAPSQVRLCFCHEKRPNSYIDKEWQTVRSTLLSDGATVVPARESNGVSPEADLEALRRADLFVQLFHGLDRLDNAKAQLKGEKNPNSKSASGYLASALDLFRHIDRGVPS